MNLTEDQLHDALETLTEDGATYVINDRFRLRIRFLPDEVSFDDIAEHGDIYGHTTYVTDRAYARGDRSRPNGYDGSARKINLRDGAVWWQPPDDLKSRKAGGFETEGEWRASLDGLRRLITDIYEYGFTVVVLELFEAVSDSFEHTHSVPVETMSIGGVEPFPDRDYVRDVVSDLLAELPDLPSAAD